MRVLQIITRFNRGGTAKWLNELNIGLQARGIENILIIGSLDEFETEEHLEDFSKIYRVPSLKRKIAIFDDLKSILIIRKIIRIEQPDVINTHTSKAGLVGRIAASVARTKKHKTIHTYHGHIIYGYFGKLQSSLFVTIEKLLNLCTSSYICSGNIVKKELDQFNIFKSKEVKIINPGFRVLNFTSISKSREMFNLNKNDFVVGWMGRFAEIKRPDRVNQLARKFPSIKFIVAGEGNLNLFGSKIPNNLIFTGWITPEKFWPACDVALSTSDNEAQPISLIEAGKSGLPIIAFNVGSIPDVVEDGVNGFLVNTAEEIGNKLELLVYNRQLRKMLGDNSRSKLDTKFNLDKFIEDHVITYN